MPSAHARLCAMRFPWVVYMSPFAFDPSSVSMECAVIRACLCSVQFSSVQSLNHV